MRFPNLRYTIIAILAGLLMLQGCAHNRVTQQDRSRPGTIGIVGPNMPRSWASTPLPWAVAGATKGVSAGSARVSTGQANPALPVAAPFLCPAIGVYGIYDGVNQAVPAEEHGKSTDSPGIMPRRCSCNSGYPSSFRGTSLSIPIPSPVSCGRRAVRARRKARLPFFEAGRYRYGSGGGTPQIGAAGQWDKSRPHSSGVCGLSSRAD